MVNSTKTANSLIREQIKNVLIEPLEAESVVLAANPTIVDSSVPRVFPRILNGFDPDFVGENELIPDDGAAEFDDIKLLPTERKSIKKIIRVSNEVIRQSEIGISTVLQRRLVKDVQNVLDEALLRGDGSDDSITGILNQPGLETAEMSTTDTDPFLDAIALAASKEVKPNRFILSSADYFALRKLKDADGRYIMQASPAEDAPLKLFDVPVTLTNKLKSGEGILANMADIAVVRDIDPKIDILFERYAEYDQVGIRVKTRYDLGILNTDSVILLKGDETEGAA